MTECNPFELSRRLAHVEQAAWDWQERWPELAAPQDQPLQAHRALLSQQQFDEVRSELPERDPLRAPVLRWLAHLLDQRVNQQTLIQCAELRYHEEHPWTGPAGKSSTLHSSVVALVEGRAGNDWFAHLVQHAAKLSEAELGSWQRRLEVARRLGYEHLDAVELPTPAVYEIAAEVFDASDALVRALDEQLGSHDPGRISRLLALGAHEVPLTFPAHLNARTVADWFRDTALLQDVKLRTFRWPNPLGGSSYALALDRFGHHLRLALAPRHQPFVIAADPLGLEAHAHGWLFASLLDNQSFQRRHLEASPAQQADVRRAIARLGLVELRLRAFKVLLRRLLLDVDHRQRASELEALSARWAGVPLPRPLLAVVPRLQASDPQRLCAIGMATVRAAELVESHNDDWFRNPRAVDQLRSESDLPPKLLVAEEQVRAGLKQYIARLEKQLQ